MLVLPLVLLGRHGWNVFDTLWAEDGAEFVGFRLRHSGLGLLTPYAGYLQLYPRGAAALAGVLPLRLAAAAAAVLSLPPVAVTLALMYRAARPYAGVAARLLAGLLMVLLPAAGGDASGNLANTHWWLVLAAVLAAVQPLPGYRGYAVAGLYLVAVMSDPTALIVLPWVLLRLRRDRGGALWAQLAALATGGAAQLVSLLVTPVAHSDTSAPAGGLAELVLRYSVGAPLLGRWATTAPVALCWALAAVVVGVLLVAVVRNRALARRAGVVWGCGLLLGILPPLLKWTPALLGVAATLRYALIPGAALWFTLLLGSALLPRRVRTVVVLVVGLAGVAVSLPTYFSPARQQGSWSAAVSAAEVWCRWAPPEEVVMLPLSPPGWRLTLTCADLP